MRVVQSHMYTRTHTPAPTIVFLVYCQRSRSDLGGERGGFRVKGEWVGQVKIREKERREEAAAATPHERLYAAHRPLARILTFPPVGLWANSSITDTAEFQPGYVLGWAVCDLAIAYLSSQSSVTSTYSSTLHRVKDVDVWQRRKKRKEEKKVADGKARKETDRSNPILVRKKEERGRRRRKKGKEKGEKSEMYSVQVCEIESQGSPFWGEYQKNLVVAAAAARSLARLVSVVRSVQSCLAGWLVAISVVADIEI